MKHRMGPGNSSSSLAPARRQIRIVVADPYPIMVQGLRKIIGDDPRFALIAEASTMASFRRKVATGQPDVALLDWSMAAKDLKVTTELLQASHPGFSIIFLTVSENSEEKRAMLRLGAHAVLSKWASVRTLHKAIYHACHGTHPAKQPPVDVARGPAPAIPSGVESESQRIQQLTYRERQLLPLVCGGLRNKEIADRLGIAETTVWHHLTSIFAKLGVEDRLALAAFGYRHQSIQRLDGSHERSKPENDVVTNAARHRQRERNASTSLPAHEGRMA